MTTSVAVLHKFPLWTPLYLWERAFLLEGQGFRLRTFEAILRPELLIPYVLRIRMKGCHLKLFCLLIFLCSFDFQILSSHLIRKTTTPKTTATKKRESWPFPRPQLFSVVGVSPRNCVHLRLNLSQTSSLPFSFWLDLSLPHLSIWRISLLHPGGLRRTSVLKVKGPGVWDVDQIRRDFESRYAEDPSGTVKRSIYGYLPRYDSYLIAKREVR